MSLYFLTFLLLAGGTLCAWFRPQYEERIYLGCWGVATVCLCFRFGQGTDYGTYHAIYETIPAVIDFSKGYICGFYPEIGWRLLSAAFKVFHAPFWVFTMVIGLAEMLLIDRFLRRYVPMKTAGLFLLYPVLFVTYMVSGLRQGWAICLFLGILVPFYMERKWVAYVLGVLLAASFHRVGYAWLVLVVAYYLPLKGMAGLTGLSVIGGLTLQIGAVEQLLVRILPVYHLKQFLLKGEISVLATGERLVSFGMVILLYWWIRREGKEVERKTELLLKAYMCNICFYMLLSGSAYYASRYAVIFKVLECAVLAALVLEKKDYVAKAVAGFFFGLTMLMGVKNLQAMAVNCGYDKPKNNFWDFPYVSVFQREAIEQYIPYEKRLWKKYQIEVEDQKLWMITGEEEGDG